ncbi:endo-polygalacturonase 6 [Fusarium beomiforme]|uniref:Endo-polygalacturonase 6 n=1 Tax=Fusarium beomiforme TaxID=44412 RepID=A0A9P5E1M3_9HYPO|nr:endo-polygalacturonase 6 [Fusarium beomiforme]
MSEYTEAKVWVFSNKTDGTPTIDGPKSTFRLDTLRLPPLREEQILVKVLYVSNDAGLRTFIGCTVDEDRIYVPPIKIGDAMHSGVISEALESNSARFRPGDLVIEPYLSWWGDKIILDTDTVQHIAPLPNNLSITHYLGACYISQKCVVGIAGSEEKCTWVTDYLGAHACVDYKSPTFVQDLKQATLDEVDIYFDNVGGAVLDGVLTRMKKFGTIARLTVKGFFLSDHMDKLPEGMEKLIKAAAEGRINVDIENIVRAKIEDMPRAWIDVYNGGKRGKSITKII